MKRFTPWFTVVLFFAVIAVGAIYVYIEYAYNKYILPIDELAHSDAVIIFGAMVYSDNYVSAVLANRLNIGAQVYKSGKAAKIIVTGDHGQKEYNEVAAMKKYLLNLGLPQDDIFMDHSGFNTYDSLYRAKEIFAVENAVFVTQEVHLKRALYIADKLNLNALGTIAPTYQQDITSQRIREIAARPKAFIQAGIIKPKPKFLGEVIPIFSNSGTVTDDKL